MPAEAPAAPPPPAPNIAPAEGERGNIPSESTSQHADALGEAFAEMDSAFGESGGAATPAEPVGKPAAAAPPVKPDPKPGESKRGPDGKFLPAEKAAPKPAEKATEPAVEKMAAWQLRKAYVELRRKHAELEEERSKTAAATPAEPQDDPEKHQLTERLTEREKRLQELEEELRYTAYERSAEYKEKYEQPFISAWQVGQDRASRLKIAEQRNEMEEVTQQARQGTPEDFNNLMSIQDDDEAANYATKMFGAKAAVLLYHREKVQEANSAKHKALEEFRTTGTAREKERQTMVENHTKAVRTMYHKSKDAGIEKYPQFFKPDEGDPKTKSLIEKGMRLADRALGAPDIEGEKPMTGEERIKLQAAMRNCFGGFSNVAYQLQKERKTRVELEKKLADYEASEPKGGDGRSGGRSTPPDAESENPESAFNAHFGT